MDMGADGRGGIEASGGERAKLACIDVASLRPWSMMLD
jgi:hypothetical protein